MPFANGEAAIIAKLKAEWPRPTVPLLFENEVGLLPPPPFVFICIAAVHERIAAYGRGGAGNEWDAYGRIEAYVHVAPLSGLALARAVRDDFAGIFRGKSFSGVTCYGVTALGSGERPDKGISYAQSAVVDFVYRFTG
jgi:hypothetical protein